MIDAEATKAEIERLRQIGTADALAQADDIVARVRKLNEPLPTDAPERLRADADYLGCTYDYIGDSLRAAADEIDQLRAEVANLRNAFLTGKRPV